MLVVYFYQQTGAPHAFFFFPFVMGKDGKLVLTLKQMILSSKRHTFQRLKALLVKYEIHVTLSIYKTCFLNNTISILLHTV